MLDNVAYTAINPPQRARLLVVTEGNEALEVVLGTLDVQRVADIEVIDTQQLGDETIKQKAADGYWDLVIYDDCQPEEHPNTNTLYLGGLPPGEQWQQESLHNLPHIIDVDVSHPLMQFLDFGNVRLATGTPLVPPPGHRVLMDSDAGPLCAVAPREGHEDVVLAFPLVATDEQGQRFANTDWPLRLSFPLFFRNVIQYLAGAAEIDRAAVVKPGQPLAIRCDAKTDIPVRNPRGEESAISRSADNTFFYQDTDWIGIYEYDVPRKPDPETRRFAVNLFDPTESNVVPRDQLETAWNSVPFQQASQAKRREIWRLLVLLAVAVLVFEWYVYNRRVYL